MKNLVLGSLIAIAASQAAGCIISSGDSSSDAHVSAIWQLKNITGAATACPSGYDTAALYNQPVDNNGTAVGSPIIDLFDCAAGAGTSAPLPPTMYQTWVEITSHNSSTNVYARSLSAYLDITNVDQTFSTTIYNDAGYFQFDWNLVGGSSGAPLSCAQAGVTASGTDSGVELIATLSGTSSATTDKFNCEDHTGVTDALPAATYTLSIDAFTSAGAVGTAPTIPAATIKPQNQVTDLMNVTIPIDGK